MEEKMIQPESRLDFEPIGAALAAVHPSLRNYEEKRAPGEFLIRQKSGFTEELYWANNVAVLSRKLEHNGEEQVMRTFSTKTKILKCFWCKFEGDDSEDWIGLIEKRHGTFIGPGRVSAIGKLVEFDLKSS